MDRAAFQRFYRETASALRGYLRLTCADAAVADDLLQETYLRLLRRSLPELNAPRLKSYLYKTAQCLLADHYRARQREARWQREQATAGDNTERGNVVGFEHVAPVGSLGLPVDMQRVFDTLNPRQQSLLWLAYVEGFKHDEIADVVGVDASSVKVLLSRARAELAARLSKQDLAPSAACKVNR